MPHVSQKKLKRKIFTRISTELISYILELESSAEAKSFLTELLTKTERIMIAKRLAVLIMLKKGYSFRVISATLHVSPSTVERYWKEAKKKSFPVLSRRIEHGWANKAKPANMITFLHTLEYMLSSNTRKSKKVVKGSLYVNR
jgi:uncharacterized protein YerC